MSCNIGEIYINDGCGKSLILISNSVVVKGLNSFLYYTAICILLKGHNSITPKFP